MSESNMHIDYLDPIQNIYTHVSEDEIDVGAGSLGHSAKLMGAISICAY